MKQPQKPATFAPPTPKVSRQKRGVTMTPAQREAFLKDRPDLEKP